MLGFRLKLYPLAIVALFMVALFFTPAGAADRVKASYAAAWLAVMQKIGILT